MRATLAIALIGLLAISAVVAHGDHGKQGQEKLDIFLFVFEVKHTMLFTFVYYFASYTVLCLAVY